MSRRRLRRVIAGLGAALALAVLLIAVPLGLALAFGWPLPSRWPSWDEVTRALTSSTVSADLVVVRGLTCLAWVAWAAFVVATVVEAISIVRGRGAPEFRYGGGVQSVARRLLTAVTFAISLPALPSPAPLPLAAAMAPATAPVAASPPEGQAPSRAVAAPDTTQPAGTSYVVRPGDTLSKIAGQHLGDVHRWPELWERNAGRLQPDGRSLTDPDAIYPGWTIDVPTIEVSGLPPSPGTAPVLPRSAQDSSASASPPSSETPAVVADADPTPPRDTPEHSIRLPSGALVGAPLAGGIATTLALLRLRRRRRYAPQLPAPGLRYETSPAERLAERLVRLTAPFQPFRDDGEPIEGPKDATPVPVAEDGPCLDRDLPALGALVLGGDGAESVARALLAHALARPGAERALVTITELLAARVFPGVTAFDGYDVVEDGTRAIAAVEAELLGRARLIEAGGSDDVEAHNASHADDALPPLLVAIDLSDVDRPHLDAVLETGRRLGLAVMAISHRRCSLPWLRVDAAGIVEEVGSDDRLLGYQGREVVHLPSADGARLAGVLRAATLVEPEASEPPHTEAFLAPATPTHPLISLQLLGPLVITAGGTEICSGLRSKAKELLAYLALRPDGVSEEVAVETLWPETEPGRGHQWFNTARGNLRGVLRKATGQPELPVVERVGDRYRLQAALFDVDVWRFEAALADVREAATPDATVRALREAADAYGGALAEGCYFGEWVEAPREDLRRRAVDVCARLADLCAEREEPEAAVDALEAAITADPYNEELYRRLMRMEAILGRPTIRRTFQRLEARLAELDVDPDPETIALLDRLSRGTQHAAALSAARGNAPGGISEVVR